LAGVRELQPGPVGDLVAVEGGVDGNLGEAEPAVVALDPLEAALPTAQRRVVQVADVVPPARQFTRGLRDEAVASVIVEQDTQGATGAFDR
jgi:hypothetical protein